MNCPCHDKPMGWQKDSRMTKGGYWECREQRRRYNANRLSVCNTKVYIPDGETREFARRLRDERKEATSGRT